ncbi:MAG: nicotinate-nucleotide--dimethylbenzimidazole phosphoribosyltransferase [Mariprofundaceae bacterium]|nr:nicotinate-nucleotide--dimethylbenzimidazole phosphoribosyltransferase [Mariprofundaceae bacterium]
MPISVSTDTETLARQHQNTLTKPAGSLGRLEDIACWFAARQGQVIPKRLQAHICIFAADHGVASEGVSAFPSAVTAEMVKNFVRGGAAINVLAKEHQASLSIVDVGVQTDLQSLEGLIHANIQKGTENLLHQAAMSIEQQWQAIEIGRQQAREAIAQGANLLIAGDMGIANTTASACIICELAHADPQDVVGRGTGVSTDMYQHKLAVVTQALERTALLQAQDVLHELGGFEIAAMTGFYLEAAESKVPMLIDGFISTAAALAAWTINPRVVAWMIASHVSEEKGHALALETLGLEPLLNMGMRLGEGSGAALCLPILQSAITLHAQMATFQSAGVSNCDD